MCAGTVAEITVLLQNERAILNVAINPHFIINDVGVGGGGTYSYSIRHTVRHFTVNVDIPNLMDISQAVILRKC